MSEERPDTTQEPPNHMVNDIGRKAQRKLRARQTRHDSIWYGMGMIGMVGWSVAIPTVLGIAIGLWLDERIAVDFSWTLTMLVLGVVVGCVNAWYWVSKEGNYITPRDDQDQDGEEDGE